MFLCCLDAVAREQRYLNNEIEKQLKKEKREGQREYKLLLLGTGESGKTTFMKQMKIISGKGFTQDDYKLSREIVRDNIADSLFKLHKYLKSHQMSLSSQLETAIEEVIKAGVDLRSFHVETIRDYWADSVVQQIFQKRGTFHVLDSFK
ncbi:guanine nucleotide-binding protein subunit alpha-14-like [Octopus sinensis]|uniref:Guanine nucleotide-binding protein subunit alpha-14-like n=1 Tax=Octopus sinensis TaxID=2607531 RepID=A0A6P7TUE6_9MOLL|nr:guanine nucleotide-binding protein subunit alpha-14-like [Octopus sinensis]